MIAERTVNFILVNEPEPELLFIPFVNCVCTRPGYPENWQKVSYLLRRVAGFRCEWCGSSAYLTVHHHGVPYPDDPEHKPGSRHDKHDLRRENLYVLCRVCHDEIEQELIERERRFNRNQRVKRCKRRKKHRSLHVGTGLVLWETSQKSA